MSTIVERDPTLAAMFRSTVGEHSIMLESLDQVRATLEDNPDEWAVVLGPSVDLRAAADLASELRVSQPAVSVILVRRRVDTGVLSEALRAGIREVVEERDLTGVTESVQRAHALWRALNERSGENKTQARGHLVTVFSPKGGVGKSTVATNLAAALVDNGDLRVCLVDLDLAFGDVAVMLQQFPTHTIADAVAAADLDEAALEALLTPQADDFYTLAAPTVPDAKDQLPAELVGEILAMLKTMFDVVVVDSAPAFDDFVLQAFDHSDLLLLVATPDVPTLKGLKVAGSTLDLLNFPRSRRRLVLNRAETKVGLTSADVEQALSVPIMTALPSSRDVPACINRGVAIVRAEPRHVVSMGFQELARQCLALLAAGRLHEPSPRQPAGTPARGHRRWRVRHP